MDIDTIDTKYLTWTRDNFTNSSGEVSVTVSGKNESLIGCDGVINLKVRKDSFFVKSLNSSNWTRKETCRIRLSSSFLWSFQYFFISLTKILFYGLYEKEIKVHFYLKFDFDFFKYSWNAMERRIMIRTFHICCIQSMWLNSISNSLLYHRIKRLSRHALQPNLYLLPVSPQRLRSRSPNVKLWMMNIRPAHLLSLISSHQVERTALKVQ